MVALTADPPLPHAFVAVPVSFTLLTPLPEYPGLKTVDAGFGAIGKRGNASVSVTEAMVPLLLADRDDGCEVGSGLADAEDAHVAVPVGRDGAPPFRKVAGSGGKRFAAEPQEPVLLTALRDDCAVEDLSFRTRFPPWDAVVVANVDGPLFVVGRVG